jgi:hypothetical protein
MELPALMDIVKIEKIINKSINFYDLILKLS